MKGETPKVTVPTRVMGRDGKEVRTLSLGVMRREFSVRAEEIDEEARTVPLSFSSEVEAERWFGIEILDHGPTAVRLDRLKDGGAFLVGHDWDDQVGVIEDARVDKDKVGRALARFSRSVRGQEIFQDIVDGIRRKISVGYVIHKLVLEKEEEGVSWYRAVDWEPFEISTVPVPLDVSVGIGRDASGGGAMVPGTPQGQTTVKTVRTVNGGQEGTEMARNEGSNGGTGQGEQRQDGATPPASGAAGGEAARGAEISRIREITAIGRQFSVESDADQYVEEGRTVEAFRKFVMEKIRGGEAVPVGRQASPDMTESERRSYSILRAMRIGAGLEEPDGLEMEVHREIAKTLGRESRGVFVPMARLSVDLRAAGRAKRALDTGTATEGQEVVQTDVLEMIELLRNRMAVRALGARVLSGLVGNVAFPRQTGSATLYWTAEEPGSDVTATQPALDQVTLSPKTAMAATAYSRQLLQQASIDVEMFVRDDLASIHALGLDLAAINGSGASNQPRGILNTTGIGSVVGGTNGLAPTWNHIVDLETEVAVDNADVGNLGYLTNAKVRGKLKKTFVDSSSNAERVWDVRAPEAPLNGYRAMVSNQVPSDLDKGTSTGVCSAILFGNWADLMIGEWGVLELILDPYTLKKQALIEIASFQMADIAVRHPQSFAAMKDALTA